MLNPLQIYTDYAITQVIAREMHAIVNNLSLLLTKTMHFVDYFKISMRIRVYSTLAFASNVYPFKSDFASIVRLPGSFISFIIM